MKKLIYLSIIATLFACSDNSSKTDQSGDKKYQEVTKIKDGFTVTHTPEKGEAILNGPSGLKYTWVYKTSITSKEKVKILEFGAFVPFNGKWIFSTYTGKPFTPKDFEEWYDCPRSTLFPNKQYTDINNWTGSDVLEASESLWYYIGETESGEQVKAMGKINRIAELQSL